MPPIDLDGIVRQKPSHQSTPDRAGLQRGPDRYRLKKIYGAQFPSPMPLLS